MPETTHFYAQLPIHPLSAAELLGDESRFIRVPEDWHVVITDIKGSTQQVRAGRHEAVNLIATGSIIASLNIAYEAGFEIPFFFGGDGATLLVPGTVHKPIMKALMEHRNNTARNFQMELRVGSVPVSKLYASGHDIQLAKIRRSTAFPIPVVLGSGLAVAESIVKGEDFHSDLSNQEADALNLEGMECRWDRIRPPGETTEVVCLLVNVRNESQSADVFKQVLDHIEAIYGTQQHRNPISVQQLKLKASLSKIKVEMRAKLGRFDLFYLLKNWIITLLGRWYFRYADQGKHYLEELPELSDTLVIDGRINTVISGSMLQRQQLTAALDQMEAAGEILFGFYVSRESVMSCYVRDREDHHIHFIDGSEGGYTQAAKMLKQKFRDLEPS